MQSLLATAFSFVPPLVDAQDHDVRCTCAACGLWRLAAARPEPVRCACCTTPTPAITLDWKGRCPSCAPSVLCPLCQEVFQPVDGVCPCSDEDRETAATALAEEAEDRALTAEEWTRVDPLGAYWRDPHSRRVYDRAGALDLLVRDAAGAR